MAWIKIAHELPDKPEVVAIATRLGIDQDAVAGKLLRLWIWFDQNTTNGSAVGVTHAFIDRYVFAPGFAKILEEIDWLRFKNGVAQLPKFERHNGETAKRRALTSKRVAENRKRNRNANSVTEALPEKEKEKEKEKEERREEKRNTPPTEASAETGEAGQSAASDPPVEDFPVDGSTKPWTLRKSRFDRYVSLYPHLDVAFEIRKAKQWIIDHPTKRKTSGGMPAFLTGWMNRAQNSQRAGPQANGEVRPMLDPSIWSGSDEQT